MNKKGMFELAELGGFVLILITTIIFGFIFVQLSPKARIEVLDVEYNYLARYSLLDFLKYNENERNMADSVILAVKQNNFSYIDKKSSELLNSGPYYCLVIIKNNKIVHYNTNIKSSEAMPVVLTESGIETKTTEGYVYRIYNVDLGNFYGDNIDARIYLLKRITKITMEELHL